MKKNFLLLLLLTLLPMAGWAANPSKIDGLTYTGSAHQLITAGTDYTNYRYAVRAGTSTALPAYSETHTNASSITGLNAGTYTVFWRGRDGAIDNTRWNSTSVQHFTVTIAKATPVLTDPVFASGLKYNVTDQPLVTTDGSTTLTGDPYYAQFQYSLDGTNWSATAPTGKDAGTYTVYYRAYSTTNSANVETVTVSAPVEVKIAKADVTITLYQYVKEWRNPWENPTKAEFGASTTSYTITGAPLVWDDVDDYLTWNQMQTVTDVDSYKYTFTVDNSNQNYDIHIAAGDADLKVVKNTKATVAGGGNGDDLVYDGTPQALNPETPCAYRDPQNNEAGKVQYKITAPAGYETDWSDDIPTATDAKTYTIAYKGVGDVNHTDKEDAAYVYTVFIDKAPANVTIASVGSTTDPEFTYDAPDFDEANFVYTKDTDADPDTYAFKKNGTSTPWDGSAGDWEVTVSFPETNNYYSGSATKTFKVGKAANAFTTAPVKNDATLIYDGTAKSLLKNSGAVAINGNGEIQYKVVYTPNVGPETTVDWSTTIPTGIAAGTYKIYYRATEGDNYLAISEAELDVVTIEKSFVTHTGAPAVIASALTFDGTDQPLLQSGKYFSGITGGHVTYYAQGTVDAVANEYDAYSKVKGKNAGEYTVSYKFFADDKNNYKDDETETEIGKVTIKQFTLYVGGNEVTGTIEDVVNLETNTPLISMADFLPVIKVKEQLPAADASADLAAILNQLVAPASDIATIIANAKVGTNPIALQKIDVAPAEGKPMNYQVDENHLLSNSASLTLSAIEAAIQTPPVGYADNELTYNGANQALVKTAGVGYKAMGGTGSVAIGKIVYSTTGEDGSWTEDLTVDGDIVGKNQGTYTVYYKVELSEEDKPENLDRFYEYTAGVKSFQVKINKKPLALDMFTFSDDDMEAEFTGDDLMPTFEAFDPVVGAPEENAIVAEGENKDFTVAKTKGSDDVEDMKNVGVYTFTFTATADGNYSGSVTADFEITPKPIDAEDVVFALETASVEYDGDNHSDDVVVNPTLPLTADDFEVVKDAVMKNQGEYTITLNAKATGNYSGSTSTTFTITKKALTDEMFALEYATKVYNGDDQMPDFTFADGDPSALVAADFNVAKTNAAEEDVTAMVDVDTYTFTFTATAAGNYSGEITKTFTITQDEAEFVLAEAANLTYNGANQGLLKNEAETDAVDGVVEYQVIFGGKTIVDWTDEFDDVVGKDAGVYTVKTKFTASTLNYSNPEVEKEVAVTIDKAAIGYMLGGMTKVWDGKKISADANKEDLEKVFTLYAGGEGGKLFGNDQYDVPFTLSLPEDYRDANEEGYTFSAAQAQEGVQFKEGYPVNYKINFSGEGKVIIKKADIDDDDFDAPTAVEEALTYKNGTAQDLVVAGEVTAKTAADYPNEELAGKPFGTIMYASAKDGEYSETAPKGEAADDYEVWYYVKGDKNHNDTDPVKIEKSIAPKAMTFALQFADATETYSGEDFMPADVVAYDGETALEADKDYTLEITDDATELVNAGTYVFTYTGIGNYEGSSAEATIVIEKKALAADMFVLAKTEVNYNGDNQKPEVTTKEGEPIVAADYEVATTEGEWKNAGTYTFTFTAAEDGNYSGEVTANFEITPLEVIAEAAAATKIYDGTEGFQDLPVLTFSGLLPNENATVFTYDASAFEIAESSADVKEGGYTFTVIPENITADNYKVVAANGNTFTITPANLMVNWNTEAEPFTKVYGAEDPELVATTANLDITGAVAGEKDAIIAGTVITRAKKDEAVGKYAITLAADPNAEVFANYNAQFEGYAEGFVITPATVKVSIAALDKTYDGQAATIEVKAENLVVTGLQNGDKKEDIFTTLPTATVGDGAAVNVGTYQVTLAGGEAADYEFEFIPATFTINPATITAATIAKQQIQKGQDVEANINATAFTIEGVVAADADKFYVTVNDEYQDLDGKVSANKGTYADGLVLAVDDAVAANYTGYDAFFGELLVIPAEATVIADNADWTKDADEAVEAVTFTDRAINAGNWNVVALPFEATVAQISEAFGYAAVDVLNEDASDGDIHFKVISSGSVPAYTPFIVKTTKDEDLVKNNFNEVVFYDVTIEAWPAAKNNAIPDKAGNEFIGTFMANTEIPAQSKEYWYMSKGTWYDTSKRNNAVNLKAFRAYVHFDPANVAAGARILVEEPDGSITAIKAISADGQLIAADGWYTVNGMKLNAAPTEKGTYIKDGKKVIVK